MKQASQEDQMRLIVGGMVVMSFRRLASICNWRSCGCKVGRRVFRICVHGARYDRELPRQIPAVWSRCRADRCPIIHPARLPRKEKHEQGA